jgi:hypothetical protein
MEIDGSKTQGAVVNIGSAVPAHPRKRRCNTKCCLWTLLVSVLLIGDALFIFFMVPRDPCVCEFGPGRFAG